MSEPSSAPEPQVPSPVESQQGQAEAQTAKEGEVLPPDQGVIAGAGSPLINALVIRGSRSGGTTDVSSAAASHFYQDLQYEKAETRRLRGQLATALEQYSECHAKTKGLEAKLEALEKPWHTHIRNIVGGGLMGVSFNIYEFSGGTAAFLFVLGLAMVCIPIAAILRKR